MTMNPLAVSLPLSQQVDDRALADDLRKLEDAADTAAAYGRFDEADGLDRLAVVLATR